MTWKASGEMDLPLADDDLEWDGDSAEDKLFDWAGWPDDKDPQKARKGFFAYNDSDPELEKNYKLPFAIVSDGKLKAVPHALHAVSVVLEGGRGGVDLPESVIDDIRGKVEKYYKKMGEAVPW